MAKARMGSKGASRLVSSIGRRARASASAGRRAWPEAPHAGRGSRSPLSTLAAALCAIVLAGAGAIACAPAAPDAEPIETRGEGTAAASVGPSATAPATLQSPSGGPAEPSEPAADDAAIGDAVRGRELVERFECSRCHDGTGVAAAPRDKHCVTCHRDVDEGRIAAPPDKIAAWREHLAPLKDVPSLASMAGRFRREWVARFLVEPHDVRPSLVPTMPRLAITPADARDIAAYLVPDAPGAEPSATAAEPAPDELEGRLARGAALFDAKGCGTCHAFTGASGISALAAEGGQGGAVETRPAVALAPDLRFARDRLRPAAVERWLLDPQREKPGTPMPRVPMTPAEAADLATFVMRAPLAPLPRASGTGGVFERLPILARRVSFEEVRERVLAKSCQHCHGEPGGRTGGGGPGVSGGFGFTPRGLRVGTYETLAAGMIGDDGRRRSVFEPLADGTPRLVAALLARHDETAGRPRSDVRGMPLGLPPLSPEDVQLVESWVAQGRPQ